MFLIAAIVWALMGVSGVWWWWTYDLDLTLGNAIIMGLYGAFTGPVFWIIIGCKALRRWIKSHRKSSREKRGPIIVLRARHDIWEDKDKSSL